MASPFSFPFLSFHTIFLLTSTGQTGKPIFMVESSNDAFPPKEVPFGVSLKKFEFTGSITPQNRQKEGVHGLLFTSQTRRIEIKTHISVKSRNIDTKFES
jgi:hypothetical protein